MRKILYISILAASCSFVAVAEKAPEIYCATPWCDFGDRDSMIDLEHSFLVWNRGNTPLVIEKVRGCCGAVVNIVSNNIAPGRNTEIIVKLSLKNKSGHVSKNFFIQSNDKKNSNYQLKMKGKALAMIDIKPRRLVFDRVSETNGLKATVSIRCKRKYGFAITNISSTVSQFQASYVSESRDYHRVVVSIAKPLPKGTSIGEVVLMTDNDLCRTIKIPVRASVVGDLVAVPDEVLILTQKAVEPGVRFIAIRSRKREEFEIKEVILPDDNMKAEVSVQDERGYQIKVTGILPFDELDGKSIVLVTDHPEVRSLEIPISVQ